MLAGARPRAILFEIQGTFRSLRGCTARFQRGSRQRSLEDCPTTAGTPAKFTLVDQRVTVNVNRPAGSLFRGLAALFACQQTPAVALLRLERESRFEGGSHLACMILEDPR